jgi:hypothetical protein
MALISKKKKIFKITAPLRKYIEASGRGKKTGIQYQDLARYNSSIPLIDRNGKDTLWETVFYNQSEEKHIYDSLRMIYAILKAGGDISVMDHLYVERVDLCVYGNTRPFRVRIMNRINDLFDYFYVKIADSSRIYGLELEHLLSPNKINFIVDGDTLIEEHIQGIPGDDFMKNYLNDPKIREIRLAKEFVKFNERCLVRLLGDMHSSNFVIEMIPDFDDTHFRIKAIDFDQQSFEGRRAIYMPQYYKQNNAIIQLGLKHMTHELELQYQKEERSLIAHRIRSSNIYLNPLLDAMINDTISTPENEETLKGELAALYKDDEFLKCRNMGEIVRTSLKMVFKHPLRKIYQFAGKNTGEN